MKPFKNEREFLGIEEMGFSQIGSGKRSGVKSPVKDGVLADQGQTICSVLPDGTFAFVNEAFCRIFGKKRSQLIGKKAFPLALPTDRAMLRRRLIELTHENPVVGVVNKVMQDGVGLRWMQFVYRGLYDVKGRLLETRVVGRDITDRVTVEEALKESNERWKFAIEGSGDGVWDWDVATGRVKFSKRWKEMLGYAEDEIGEGFQEWESRVHPADLPAAQAGLKAHFDGLKDSYVQEFRMRKKEGGWKWILARGHVISRDEKGQPLRVIGTHTDISTAKAAKKRETFNLKLVAEGAPCGAVLDAIVRSVEAEHPGLQCMAMIVDESRQTLRLLAAPSLPEWFANGMDGMKIGARVSCSGSAAYHGQREVTEDIRVDKRWKGCRGPAEKAGVRSCWAEPILSRSGKVLGVLSCYHRQARRPSRAETSTISNAVSLAAVAIEREKEERALRESERKFRAVFEQAAVGVAVIETPTGRFLDVNHRMCEIVGYSQAELLEKTFMEITHPEDLDVDLGLMRRLVKCEIPSFAMEKRYCKIDGSICWVSLTVSALWQEGEEPLQHMAVVQDITGRKVAEANYRREVEYNRALVSSTSVFMTALNTEGRFIHVNQAFLSGLGYKEKEILNHTPWEIGLLEGNDPLVSKGRFHTLLLSGDNPAEEIRIRSRNGEWRTVYVESAWTRTLNGEPDRLILTGTDVTERNRLEREVLNIVEREQARLGHDLHDGVGQTMTGIVALIEVLEMSLQGAVKEDAARIRQLIQDAVGEIRRMSHGLSPTSVKYRGLKDALQMLAETVTLNHRTPCESKVEPSIQISDPEMQTHLFRIAQEAVNNALKHGNPDNVGITMKRLDGDVCVLMVEDDGTGLPGAKSKASVAASGSASPGIGMRVMEYRAKLIGADLQVKSRDGGGVVVECQFRADQAE